MGVRRVGFCDTVGFRDTVGLRDTVGFSNTVGFRGTGEFLDKGEFYDTVWHPVMHIRTLHVIGALHRGQNLLCIQIAQMYLVHSFAVL